MGLSLWSSGIEYGRKLGWIREEVGLRVNEEVGLSFWEWVMEVVGLSMGESGIEYGIKWD